MHNKVKMFMLDQRHDVHRPVECYKPNMLGIIVVLLNNNRTQCQLNRTLIYSSIADALLAVYIVIILGYDYMFDEMFVLGQDDWPKSKVCKLISAFATFAIRESELSLFMVAMKWF